MSFVRCPLIVSVFASKSGSIKAEPVSILKNMSCDECQLSPPPSIVWYNEVCSAPRDRISENKTLAYLIWIMLLVVERVHKWLSVFIMKIYYAHDLTVCSHVAIGSRLIKFFLGVVSEKYRSLDPNFSLALLRCCVIFSLGFASEKYDVFGSHIRTALLRYIYFLFRP